MTVIRDAVVGDLDAIAEMLEDFVATHPAKSHARSKDKLRDALFGDAPVAHVLVAVDRERVVGMVQWSRIFEMFWGMFGGKAEWLYVRPEARGRAVAAMLGAEVCKRVRDDGGEFLYLGSVEPSVTALYDRVTHSWPERTHALSAEAFQRVADLAGASPRELARNLPSPELNRVPASIRDR
ncbi:MAG TPA: GNAT family N-acetyltransferase [Kofleriaceae bacterium]